jgi:hypothetical protein
MTTTTIECHDTMFGQRLISEGTDPETVAHNALFRPTTV